MRIESAEALQPYLNPDYWNGHSLGYGEPTGQPTDSPIFGRQLRQAKQNLQDRLARMERAIPIETFNEGQVFDPSQYELGTVMLFREESLTGKAEDLEVDVGNLKGQSIPARPMDASPSFGRTSTSQTITDGNINYFTAARWGIVALDKSNRQVMNSVSTGLVDKLGGGKVLIAVPSLRTHVHPTMIGETRHHIGKYSERLVRVNILDVVAYGEAEKKKQPLKNFAARLAFGHNRN